MHSKYNFLCIVNELHGFLFCFSFFLFFWGGRGGGGRGGGGGGGRLNAKEFFDITALVSINVMDLVGGF